MPMFSFEKLHLVDCSFSDAMVVLNMRISFENICGRDVGPSLLLHMSDLFILWPVLRCRIFDIFPIGFGYEAFMERLLSW